jgi:NIMA (never in mitosis gene a)-related kinase
MMGIKTLHDLKILHRDLKSANVFLFKDGTVKIGDMNVSKIAKQGLLHTQTGTPYYASPEVWNDSPYDSK